MASLILTVHRTVSRISLMMLSMLPAMYQAVLHNGIRLVGFEYICIPHAFATYIDVGNVKTLSSRLLVLRAALVVVVLLCKR